MIDTKEALLMLSSFSLQVHMFERAATYAKAGLHLFPNDTRLIEVLAYAHLHNNDLDDAQAVLANATEETANIAFLHAKLAILTSPGGAGADSYLRRYLQLAQH